MILHQVRGAAILALALLCACSRHQTLQITGDTPGEVAQSIFLVQDRLPPDVQQRFASALNMLKLTAADRYTASQYASITPGLVQLIKGRTPYEIIQMASVYRSAIPDYTLADLPRRDRRQRSDSRTEKAVGATGAESPQQAP